MVLENLIQQRIFDKIFLDFLLKQIHELSQAIIVSNFVSNIPSMH